MEKYGVACAKSKTFTDKKAAEEYVKQHGAPIVIKADGLAAGRYRVISHPLYGYDPETSETERPCKGF